MLQLCVPNVTYNKHNISYIYINMCNLVFQPGTNELCTWNKFSCITLNMWLFTEKTLFSIFNKLLFLYTVLSSLPAMQCWSWREWRRERTVKCYSRSQESKLNFVDSILKTKKILPFYDTFDFDQRLGLGFDFVDHLHLKTRSFPKSFILLGASLLLLLDNKLPLISFLALQWPVMERPRQKAMGKCLFSSPSS